MSKLVMSVLNIAIITMYGAEQKSVLPSYRLKTDVATAVRTFTTEQENDYIIQRLPSIDIGEMPTGSLQLSNDGALIVYDTQDGHLGTNVLHLCRTADGHHLQTIQARAERTPLFKRDSAGNLMLIVPETGQLVWYDVQSGERRRENHYPTDYFPITMGDCNDELNALCANRKTWEECLIWTPLKKNTNPPFDSQLQAAVGYGRISKDGKNFAIYGSNSNKICLYNIDKKSAAHLIIRISHGNHEQPLTLLEFSDDSSTLITGSDKLIQLRNMAGALVATVTLTDDATKSLIWPTGFTLKNQIVPLALPSAIKGDNVHQLPLVILDSQTLQPIAHLPFTDPGSFLIHMFPARFSDDGSTLATSTFNIPNDDTKNKNRIDLWRLFRNKKSIQLSSSDIQKNNDVQNELHAAISCCASCCTIS